GGQFDQLTIGGTKSANLAGTLDLSLINAFTPTLGQHFPIISFGSHGATTFDTINGLPLPNGLMFDPQYNATNLTLVAVGSPLTSGDPQSSALTADSFSITPEESTTQSLTPSNESPSAQSPDTRLIVEELLSQPPSAQPTTEPQNALATSFSNQTRSALNSVTSKKKSALEDHPTNIHAKHATLGKAQKTQHDLPLIAKQWGSAKLMPSPKWIKDFLLKEDPELDIQITV
ncbi:MAG: hypothetical protein OEY91_12905, partial [Nitrospirota bacterium]|nr:hypothetical protein [Nitrospirota bacterium]